MPYWGLAILGTTLAFFVPLVYKSNQELIDHHLSNATNAINTQTAQVREVASKQAAQVSAISKQYAGDYTDKVQGMLGGRGPASKSGENLTVSPKLPVAPTEDPSAGMAPLEPVVPDKYPMVAS